MYIILLDSPSGAGLSSLSRFRDHTQTHYTQNSSGQVIGSCRDLYLTTHNTHNRETCMRPAGFESTITASERPQTHNLDRAATGSAGYIMLHTGICFLILTIDFIFAIDGLSTDEVMMGQ
jgi:hypothetical protein